MTKHPKVKTAPQSKNKNKSGPPTINAVPCVTHFSDEDQRAKGMEGVDILRPVITPNGGLGANSSESSFRLQFHTEMIDVFLKICTSNL